MREMGPSFVTVAAQGFYRSRVRNCYPLPARGKRHIACHELFHFNCKAHRALILPLPCSSVPNRIHCVWLRFGAAHRSPELFAGGLFPQTERTAHGHGRSSFFHMYHHFRARTGSGSTLRVCRISSQTVVCLKKLPMVMGSQLSRKSQ